MSVSIDRIIKKAEKSAKFGDFNAAKSTCYEGLEKYPNNPRLNALEKRLTNAEPSKIVRLPQAICEELTALSEASQFILLIKRCSELLERYENSPMIWNILGSAQLHEGFQQLAEASLKKCIEIAPTYYAGYSNLGNVYLEVGRLGEAEAMHRKAAKLAPFCARTQNNFGALLEELGRYKEAFEYFKKAASLEPDYATAVYNLAAMNLKFRNFSDGWQQRESRWTKEKKEPGPRPIVTAKPLWDGSEVDRLFVWSEQGVGDEVMFASCFNDLVHACNHLTVACERRLIPIFQRSFGSKIQFVDRLSEFSDEHFDTHAPMLTATGFVRGSIDAFNSSANGYLKTDKTIRESLRQTLAEHSKGKKIVGISWLSKNERLGKKRSISPVELVSALPDDYFLLNLQYGDVSEQLSEIRMKLNRAVATFDNIDNWNDLDLFSNLIAACDKVVSIDNSTVHFAGALGIECHVLLPHSSDWRWGLQDERRSYWYNSLQLHHQSRLDDWTNPIKSLVSALNENSPR